MNGQAAVFVMKMRGFSLIELIVALVITAIVLVMALPAFSEQVDKRRLVAAADALYGDMQYARSEAIRSNQNVKVSFTSGSNWCYGMIASSTACNCAITSSATSGYCSLKRVDYNDFSKVSIAAAGDITFASSTTGFDPVRGVSLASGSVTLTSAQGKKARLSLALLGRFNLCAPAVSGVAGAYPSC